MEAIQPESVQAAAGQQGADRWTTKEAWTMDEQGERRAAVSVSRRRAVGGITIGAASALFARSLPATAQPPTPTDRECVTTAPALDESGIAFVPLLVGGIVHDMPAGPVEVRISRLAMAPGTTIEAAAVPYPTLMYIETGTTSCPGGPGRIGYGPDGAIVEQTTGEGIQYTSAGSTQYIPANVPDGAGNEESGLMSSIVIEFVPVTDGGTSAATT
jgi:hypothetical protein